VVVVDTNETDVTSQTGWGGQRWQSGGRAVSGNDLPHLSVKRHSRVTVCCAGRSKVSQAGPRPNRRSTSLDQNARKAHRCQP
jgi:hypothetical protein